MFIWYSYISAQSDPSYFGYLETLFYWVNNSVGLPILKWFIGNKNNIVYYVVLAFLVLWLIRVLEKYSNSFERLDPPKLYTQLHRIETTLNHLHTDKEKNNISKIVLVLLIGVLIRMLIGYSNYSGQSDPPKFGDFEAQRHWMEVTLNLPVNNWYINNEHNNIKYWPLDYPPLTAYHSMLCGYFAYNLGFNEFVELESSKGLESESFKWFMRGTVLISDILIFFSSLVYYWFISNPQRNIQDSHLFLLVSLTSVPHIYVDHSHFQYNCVAIGLIIWSINFLYIGNKVFSIIALVSAIFFKQTMLYFLPGFFFIFLSELVNTNGNLKRFKKLCIYISTGFITVFVLLFPFIIDSIKTPEHYSKIYPITELDYLLVKFRLNFAIPIVRRVIPIWRGAWENHVASFWFGNIFIFNLKKWAMLSEHNLLMALKICTTATSMGFIPSCLSNLKSPTKKKFELSLFASSLSFFLFSWQVHEKSIILPLTPALLLMDVFPWLTLNMTILSSFSLTTLSILDKNVPYLLLFATFNITITFSILHERMDKSIGLIGKLYNLFPWLITTLFVMMLTCHYFIPPPKKHPWLHEYLNALICSWILLLFLLISTLECFSYLSIIARKTVKTHGRKKE
ncbi:glucosyltransferase [Cryptosporidium ryanae]|uniref:glucosyltransferase n=1 Tax=Cryptosporidium ryanae TaxID=515981 RepID=UPI00351A050E|nr:glucosyltransferase [Cryptosporidium ryanae]